jgi:hypothetical protein
MMIATESGKIDISVEIDNIVEYDLYISTEGDDRVTPMSVKDLFGMCK